MNTKVYAVLPEESKQIRVAVFMDEQGYAEEFDELDSICKHVVLFDEDKPIGTCRYYKDQSDYAIGRVALIQSVRGQHLGEYIISKAEGFIKEEGGSTVKLHAQLRVKKFYEKQGYSICSEVDYDEGVEHIWMKKEL